MITSMPDPEAEQPELRLFGNVVAPIYWGIGLRIHRSNYITVE
jgi:hypothetical protein